MEKDGIRKWFDERTYLKNGEPVNAIECFQHVIDFCEDISVN